MNRKQRRMLLRIVTAGCLLVALQFAPLQGALLLLAAFGIYLIIGYDILLKSARSLMNGALLDENCLMAIASIGAFVLGIHSPGGDSFTEAIAVVLFYQVGELFQSCAVAKSRRNIAELMDIRPDTAHMEQSDGTLSTVSPEEVPVGGVIIVQPGEKIPLDGTVLEGSSTLNTSALTGESLPRSVFPGEAVASGCINLQGILRVRTTKEFSDSTVSKILELVEEATCRKSRSEQFISRFARVYTPLVCTGALLLALLPPLILMAMGEPAVWSEWLYRALIFLVISCPCALVISIPLSFFAGIGGASRAGVLIKGANFMETLAQARQIAFDKTGTLTQGCFEVVGMHHNTLPADHLLELAALAECASSHPISKSLRNAYGREPNRTRVADICELAGLGITAQVDGHQIALGSIRLMEQVGAHAQPCHHPGTIVHMAIDGAYAGHWVIADIVKPHAAEALQQLRQLGIRRTVMLTGDTAAAAESIAASLGIDEVYSELLPAHKVDRVEALLVGGQGKLIFVGDGVNDAPVLSRADVGIAMGGMGADAAIEAADVVLMQDDPLQVPKAICIARRCISIVYQNITLALGIKFACLALGALGLANMWFAIFADVGVMVLAILNAIRALRIPRL